MEPLSQIPVGTNLRLQGEIEHYLDRRLSRTNLVVVRLCHEHTSGTSASQRAA